jgi:uncharacterized membrane protein YqjE
MNRHAFRWDGLAFGLFFLAALGQWAVWEQDLLDPDELAYVAAAVLIVLGVLGIAGTAISARTNRRTAPFTPTTTSTTVDDEPEIEPAADDTTENADTHGGNPA